MEPSRSDRPGRGGRLQFEADTLDGEQLATTVWLTIQLMPDRADVNIQRMLTDGKPASPYEIDQFTSAEYFGRLPHERPQNGEGFGGELHLSSGEFHLVRVSIQFDGAHLIDASTHGIAPRPPQIGTDLGDQQTVSVPQIMDAVHPTLQVR